LPGALDPTPFAAVFFLLVILLVLHSSLAPAPGVLVQLPAVIPGPRPGFDGPELVVTIDRNGVLYFEHQVVAEEELRQRLTAKVQASREPLHLLLLADEAVPHGAVVQLATLAQAAGIREIVEATREPLFPANPEPPRKQP
jgi:biopolymer transport protein ExbD